MSDVEYPKMDPEAKRLWVEALRSGQYAQATGRLRTPPEDLHDDDVMGYCCLGVWCDVDPLLEWDENTAVIANYDAYAGLDPDEARYLPDYMGEDGEWYGTTQLPDLVRERIGLSPDAESYCINLNDGFSNMQGQERVRKHTFAEIADFIEENL